LRIWRSMRHGFIGRAASDLRCWGIWLGWAVVLWLAVSVHAHPELWAWHPGFYFVAYGRHEGRTRSSRATAVAPGLRKRLCSTWEGTGHAVKYGRRAGTKYTGVPYAIQTSIHAGRSGVGSIVFLPCPRGAALADGRSRSDWREYPLYRSSAGRDGYVVGGWFWLGADGLGLGRDGKGKGRVRF